MSDTRLAVTDNNDSNRPAGDAQGTSSWLRSCSMYHCRCSNPAVYKVCILSLYPRYSAVLPACPYTFCFINVLVQHLMPDTIKMHCLHLWRLLVKSVHAAPLSQHLHGRSVLLRGDALRSASVTPSCFAGGGRISRVRGIFLPGGRHCAGLRCRGVCPCSISFCEPNTQTHTFSCLATNPLRRKWNRQAGILGFHRVAFSP